MTSKRRWTALAVACAAVLALVLWWSHGKGSPSEPPVRVAKVSHPAPAPVPAEWHVTPRSRPAPPKVPVARGASDAQAAEARLQRAEEKLQRYRESTRYPPDSRPASEEPDRMHIHRKAERTRPLDKDPSTLITVGQDRTFMTADETARLWVKCETKNGLSIPCRVTSAQVSVVPREGEAAPRPVPLAFDDDGAGTSTALLRPSALGLGDVSGTLRVDLSVTDDREVGHPFFTLVSTGGAPAKLTGQVTDAVVGGSLRFEVGIDVKTAGQYVLHGRVDDADGRPLAWVDFDQPLTKGTHAVPLVVFGKLIRDAHPAFPLELRDMDGFLLLPNAFPDRKVIAALAGPVHRTALYDESQFSDAEWTSAERTRYLNRYGQDVDRAQAEVDGTSP